jgi:hypothetical protein
MGDNQSASDSGGSVRTFLIADVRSYANNTQSFPEGPSISIRNASAALS